MVAGVGWETQQAAKKKKSVVQNMVKAISTDSSCLQKRKEEIQILLRRYSNLLHISELRENWLTSFFVSILDKASYF